MPLRTIRSCVVYVVYEIGRFVKITKSDVGNIIYVIYTTIRRNTYREHYFHRCAEFGAHASRLASPPPAGWQEGSIVWARYLRRDRQVSQKYQTPTRCADTMRYTYSYDVLCTMYKHDYNYSRLKMYYVVHTHYSIIIVVPCTLQGILLYVYSIYNYRNYSVVLCTRTMYT